LAAILIAGYRRLFPADEADSLTAVTALLTEIILPLIPQFGGHVVNSTGERMLSEFDSVVEATRCAAALRSAVSQRNRALPQEQRVAVSIGINLGDIVFEADDIFGDGVNVAARIEGLAEPGGICVSEIVYDQVTDKVDFVFEDLGPQVLKNIRRPVRVFRMGGEKAHEYQDNAAVATSPAFDDRRAVAVLPFANFSGDPEQEFFADGITEDIISMLAGWRAFPVIARNSTFNYKGKTLDVK
jgi:class 3 adenylate cyclase